MVNQGWISIVIYLSISERICPFSPLSLGDLIIIEK
jgi:hypothetical protein